MPYDSYLHQALADLGDVAPHEGGSGYFSKPDEGLDPRLFNGKFIRPEVRGWILQTLYDYWDAKYRDPQAWSTVWLAGSGISYQWAADRSNGDLDVLMGANWSSFFQHNPQYLGFSESELADIINKDLKTNLWPKTANQEINGGVFEVTFYLNAESEDIRDINPYAAYNLTTNGWTVTPPELPEDPESLYPQEWWDAAQRDKEQAQQIISRYNALHSALNTYHPSSPGWHNTMAQIDVVTAQASALFDDIHLGRKEAFGPTGSGYGDFHNFRWQANKRYGTVQALNSLSTARRDAHKAQETELYGAPITDAHEALTHAALARSIR